MNSRPSQRDLFVLVADTQMQATIEGLLTRRQALGIRELNSDVKVHPRKDAGCRSDAAAYLRPFSGQFQYCLVVFDHEGCGREEVPPDTIRESMLKELSASGWKDRCEVVVIVPELESWVWNPSRKVDEICGWSGRTLDLRTWVTERFDLTDVGKPRRPKEALDAALREVGKVRSSSLFRQMATNVSWRGCTDHAFRHLVHTLKTWFLLTQE